MKLQGRSIRRVFGLLIIIAFICAIAVVCMPRKYCVEPWATLPGTRYLALKDGSRIGYQLLLPDTARSPYPILFLQGGPGGYVAAATLDNLRPFCEAGFQVYAYDQIGSGSSSRLDDIRSYGVRRHIADLDALIEAAGAERVVLIGQSWGGILAAMFAAVHPERIAGIVFTCPGPLPPRNPALAAVPPPDSLKLRAPQFSNRQANDEAATWRSDAAAWLGLHFGYKLMPDAEADAFQSTLNRLLARSTLRDPSKVPAIAQSGNGYYAQLMTMSSLSAAADPRPLLRRLRVPVLILKGQYDNQSWGVTQEYAQLFSESRLAVIPGAGHSIAAEQPGAYRDAIRGFLVTNFLR